MSLFSNLLETYNKCNSAIGIVKIDENGNTDEKKTFLPIFHTTFKTQICVTLDAEGNFINITRDKKDLTIIIPCTEKSLSRSGSAKIAHPLCDQLGYVDKNLVPDKFEVYINQLKNWKENNPKLNAIYQYLQNNSVVEAVLNASLFKENEMEDGQPVFEKIFKIGVRFSVQIPEDNYPNVWEDKELRDLWIENQMPIGELDGFDYLSGENLTSIASTHPKNINSATGNAKLISCNDKAGLTFRGRFTEQNEAVQIDSVSTQKAHQTLRWLINNYGYHTENQVIVIWAVDDNTEEKINPRGSSFDVFCDMDSYNSETDILNQVSAEIEINYAQKVINALKGYESAEKLKQHDKKIIISIFDAATTGRMGVTFYQEFPRNEYLENIIKWHEDSAWHLSGFIKQKNEKGKAIFKVVRYIGCPSFNDILVAVYGKPRGGNDTGYTKLKKQVQKQLLECMFGNLPFPKNYIDQGAVRASHPMSFTDSNNSFKENDWRYYLNVTCSLIKKYYKKQKEEDISMELEEFRNDRDYLYGRLLAVADKLENYAMFKANKNRNMDDRRATNAIRLMSGFSVKPYSTWKVLWNQLIPYINQLNGAAYHLSIIDSIMILFKSGEFEDNKPLSPLYLLGYSAQNRALIKKEKKEESNNDSFTE